MAIAPLRRRAGKIDIENRQRKIREETKLMKENFEEKPITEEEHKARLEKLKELGLIK